MNNDAVERDRLLTRLDTNVQYLVEGHKNTIQALIDHAKVDDTRFGAIDKTLSKINTNNAYFIGKIYGGSAVVTAVVTIVLKIVFK